MKTLVVVAASWLFMGAQAAPLITPEFEALLKENYALKQRGTPDAERFLTSARTLADKGDPSAQYIVGMMLMKAERQQSKEYFQQSSRAGCVGSATWLGVLYLQEKNREEGVPLLVKAAENGDATAQVYMSGAYERGDVFEKNIEQAYAWLKLAERQSFSDGALVAIREGLSKLERQFSPEQKAGAEQQFAAVSRKIGVVDYTFCGQANPDTSRSANVPDHFKM